MRNKAHQMRRLSRNRERLDELCDEISNLIDAVAHGALRSSPMLAQRLSEAELKLAAEEERVALQQGVGAVSPPQSVRFYQRFVSTLAKRFKESARETRATLTELRRWSQIDGHRRPTGVDSVLRLGQYDTATCTAHPNSG
jgi:hypothetical protein